MKSFFLPLFLLVWPAFTFAQDTYFVTVVKGGVTKKDGTPVTVGSKLLLTDHVNLATRESLLILLSPDRGRVVVSPGAAKPNKENNFTLLIRDFLKIEGRNVRLSTNALVLGEKGIGDLLRPDPAINTKILVIDTLKIPIPGSMGLKPDTSTCYFYLQPLSGNPVQHRLIATGEYLYITRTDIFFTKEPRNGKAGKMKLVLVNKAAGETKPEQVIAVFEPVYITRETCAALIQSVKRTMPDATDYSIIREVRMQLYYAYGKPDETEIESIYNSLQ